MNNKARLHGRRIQTIIILVSVTILALLAVGSILFMSMGRTVNDFFMKNCRFEASTEASAIYSSLADKMTGMEYTAYYIEQNLLNGSSYIELAKEYKVTGARTGLARIDGTVIAGDQITNTELAAISDSFRGTRIIRYVENSGLVLACPVFHGDNVQYSIYTIYPQPLINSTFKLSMFEGNAAVKVITDSGNIVIPTQGRADSRSVLYSEKFNNLFNKLYSQMVSSDTSALLYHPHINEHYYVYASKIPNTDFILTGAISRDQLSGNIWRIVRIVLWIYGITSVTLVLAIVYLAMETRKAHEAETLRAARDEAESASKAKSDFLANMSHEIRTPINAILGMDEMILRESGDANIKSYASSIRNASNSLLGIINDILDFSKIEAGKMDLIPAKYSLSSLLNDLHVMVDEKARTKGLELKFEINPDIPDSLYGDELRIKQIILNILNNAVKYTKEGSVRLTADYKQTNTGSVDLTFHIIDTGIGIKSEDLEILGNPFSRIEEDRNRNIEGTGLGMSITTKLLYMMGSRMEIESDYGHGSDFHFTLNQRVISWDPVGDFAERVRQQSMEQKAYHESFIAPDARLLVVDDTPVNLTVVESLLKATQVQIDTADSGAESVEKASLVKYDLILMDHRMPEMDGTEAMQHIRNDAVSLNKETPIIILTANAVSGMRDIFLSEGFDDYLSKPVSPKALEEMVHRHIPASKIKASDAAKDITSAGDDGTPDDITIKLNRLSDLGTLNISAGVEQCGGAQSYITVCEQYVAAADTNRKRIGHDLQVHDIKDYTIKVHALKSSSRIIGAAELSAMAAHLEHCGDNNDVPAIEELTPALLLTYGEIARSISEALSVGVSEDQGELISQEELQDTYNTILELCEATDFDSMDMMIKELSGYRIPEDEKDKFDKLKEYITDADAGKIRELLG